MGTVHFDKKNGDGSDGGDEKKQEIPPVMEVYPQERFCPLMTPHLVPLQVRGVLGPVPVLVRYYIPCAGPRCQFSAVEGDTQFCLARGEKLISNRIIDGGRAA
jgi:hypothetical protein